MPNVEAVWKVGREQPVVRTPGYTRRVNAFITLIWPSRRIVWNVFKRRRNVEFRRHLSNVMACAKRHRLRRVIMFFDQATYHRTAEVKRFIKGHRSMLTAKLLGKKDPNSNPAECLVNRRLNSAICVNRCHASVDAMKRSARGFLRKYNSIYAT